MAVGSENNSIDFDYRYCNIISPKLLRDLPSPYLKKLSSHFLNAEDSLTVAKNNCGVSYEIF